MQIYECVLNRGANIRHKNRVKFSVILLFQRVVYALSVRIASVCLQNRIETSSNKPFRCIISTSYLNKSSINDDDDDNRDDANDDDDDDDDNGDDANDDDAAADDDDDDDDDDGGGDDDDDGGGGYGGDGDDNNNKHF